VKLLEDILLVIDNPRQNLDAYLTGKILAAPGSHRHPRRA